MKNQLLSGGSRPSLRPTPWSRELGSAEAQAAYQRIRPFAEAMYLVMAADETALDDRERITLRGALRSLSSAGVLGTSAMGSMLSEFERLLAVQGFGAATRRRLRGSTASQRTESSRWCWQRPWPSSTTASTWPNNARSRRCRAPRRRLKRLESLLSGGD